MPIKYIKPLPIKYVLKEISKCLKDKTFPLRDADLLDDRNKFILHNYDYEMYRSNDEDDMDNVFWESIRTICIEIGQVINFRRIIRTTKDGIPILPKDYVPQHLNPLKQKDYDKSTLTEKLEKLQVDEMYSNIENEVGDVNLLEKKDMPLEMVRNLNILNNDIDNTIYKKQIEFGKKYPKVRDKIIKASQFLQKLVRKMR